MFSIHAYAYAFDPAAVAARASLIQHIGVDHPSPVHHMLEYNTNVMLLLTRLLPSAFNILPFPQTG
jgi:hypothetical protein